MRNWEMRAREGRAERENGDVGGRVKVWGFPRVVGEG